MGFLQKGVVKDPGDTSKRLVGAVLFLMRGRNLNVENGHVLHM